MGATSPVNKSNTDKDTAMKTAHLRNLMAAAQQGVV